MQIRKVVLAASGVVFAFALTIPAAASADSHGTATRTADTAVSTHKSAASRSSAESAENYWTPQRMRRAVEADTPADAKASRKAAVDAAAKPSQLAKPQKATTSKKARGIRIATSIVQGKVFFHNPTNGGDYACSAAAVNNPTKNMVFTAGHCVHGGAGGTWATNWVFVPAYYNGSRPYGTWSAKTLTSFNGWINSSDLNYDIGVANVWDNGSSKLVNTVGGMGLGYNYGYVNTVTVWGYPAAFGYDGEVPYVCQNIGTWQDGSRVQNGCTMVEGASGGPWLRDYNETTGLGTEIGVTSTRTDPPAYIDSPYFDNKIQTIYDNTANG
ncbi:peptidase [Streptomyces mordarskii]|uniref:Peptidase n=2 Tax=Streptomyces TaxID=1883 RepID=A0ABN1DVD9_9ACTN